MYLTKRADTEKMESVFETLTALTESEQNNIISRVYQDRYIRRMNMETTIYSGTCAFYKKDGKFETLDANTPLEKIKDICFKKGYHIATHVPGNKWYLKKLYESYDNCYLECELIKGQDERGCTTYLFKY